MAIDRKYSLWISTIPQNNNGYVPDFYFMYIGSTAQLPMNITYNSSTVGILGDTPDTAIFVDGTGGAVLKMSISAVRPNLPQILGIDTRIVDEPNTCSNKKFIETLTNMRSAIQMMNPAYILRAYNLSTLSLKDYDTPLPLIEAKRSGQPIEIPVYLDSFDVSIDLEQPNVVNANLNLIQRNLKVGFNE